MLHLRADRKPNRYVFSSDIGKAPLTTGHPRRLWIITTMSIQTLLLLVFCFLISPLAPKSFEYQGEWEWVSMLCSALACGAQFAMVSSEDHPAACPSDPVSHRAVALTSSARTSASQK